MTQGGKKSPAPGSSILPCLSKLFLLTLSEKRKVQELFKADLWQVCALVSQCPLSTPFLLCTDIECAWCGSGEIPLKKEEPLTLNIKVDKNKQKIL